MRKRRHDATKAFHNRKQDLARKMAKAIGVARLPEIWTIPGVGYVSFGNLTTDQLDIVEHTPVEKLREYAIPLRQVAVWRRQIDLGLVTTREVWLPGTDRCVAVEELSEGQLEQLEQASNAALRTAFSFGTGGIAPRDRRVTELYDPATRFAYLPEDIGRMKLCRLVG